MPHPVVLKADMSVFEAAHLILQHRISGACVVDESRRLIGIVSELDCMRLLLSAAYNDDEFVEGLVQDVMATTDLETGSPGHDIVDVAMSMLDHKPRRRPVVDEGGGLIGQVTCRQILRAIKEVRGYKDLTER